MAKIVKRTVDQDDKKCPFNQSAGIMCDCLKESCALWLDEAEQCSIPVLARKTLGSEINGRGEK
jgi:hypothetical protein